MAQGNFDWFAHDEEDRMVDPAPSAEDGEEMIVERVELLKKKLAELVGAARSLREEKSRLAARVVELERELAQKNERLALLEEHGVAVERMRRERDTLLQERGEVRTQIEELLEELEGIELG